MTSGIWQNFTRAHESLKIVSKKYFIGSFYTKEKMHEFKIYRGVMCYDNEELFEKELTSQFKTDIRNLINFDLSTQKSQKFTL